MPKFIESCVVGVNVWGSSPRRFVDPIKMMSEVSIRDHVRPFGECVNIICLVISLINHCWAVVTRLLINLFVVLKNRVGNIMMGITMGRPISVGVAKEVNRFSFIFCLMGCVFC